MNYKNNKKLIGTIGAVMIAIVLVVIGFTAQKADAKMRWNGDKKRCDAWFNGACIIESGAPCGNFNVCTKAGQLCTHHGGPACGDFNACGGNGGWNPPVVVSTHTVNTRYTSTYTKNTRNTLIDTCTQGVDCPGDELGKLVKSFIVSPAFASDGRACPLYWTPGSQTDSSKIVCSLITNGISAPLPQDGSNQNVVNIPIGTHTLSCVRQTTEVVTQVGDTEATFSDGHKAITKSGASLGSQTNTYTTPESHQVDCKQVPKVIEK